MTPARFFHLLSKFMVGTLGGSLLLAGLQGGMAASDAQSADSPVAPPAELAQWCTELKASIASFKWDIDPCAPGIQWKVGGKSIEGRPLVYTEFGDPSSHNVSLILSSVHGDEITPVYIGIQLVNWVKQHESELKKERVIIAPFVNPDGFYKKPRTRTNARGVDVNRNFATHDWQTGARRWKVAFRSDPRRNPGSAPRSEPETLFQEELIRQFRPLKIMTIHSPLNHLDYDGPSTLSLSKFPRQYVSECLKLQKSLKAKSTGYFPGSLGNYAGRELGIPTLTLELPSADHTKAEAYWRTFSQGIRTMIEFTMPPNVALQELIPSQGRVLPSG